MVPPLDDSILQTCVVMPLSLLRVRPGGSVKVFPRQPPRPPSIILAIMLAIILAMRVCDTLPAGRAQPHLL